MRRYERNLSCHRSNKECEAKAERHKDCFQPKSNEKPLEEVAKAFQLGLAFGLMDGLNAKNDDMREEELRKLEKPYCKNDPKESEVENGKN